MAIDQEIAQRVDAYRGNPQALQQRYAANQELLDLLALQRLKSEKDDAMRKVQMEMEQNPQTIKQQKERQLLEMTKQDLTNQTAGIMQNAQKKQQKNMQRVAKQGSANPQQVQKMQAGLGALAQRQQQQGQAPMRMAAGGIVAFAEGGITQADIDAYRRGGGQSRRARAKMTDEQIRAILERSAGPDTSGYEMVQTRRGLRRKPMALAPVELGEPIETAELEEKDAEVETDPLAPNTIVASEETPVVAEEVVEEVVEEPPVAPEGGLAAMLKENTLTAPQIDKTGINANQAGKGILSSAGIGAQDPAAARRTARDDAATFLKRDDKRNTMNEYLKELKAMDVSQQDPKKLRDQEISAFLRGTAGGGSFGQTMAGGSQGMADERSAQEKSSRDRLLSRLNIEKSAMDMDMNIAKSAQASGDSAYAQAMQNQRTIASVLSQTRGQEVQLATKEAQLEFDANKGNVQNILKGLELEYNDALRRGIAEGDRAMRAGQILGKLQVDRAKFFEEALANDPTYRNAQIAANQENAPEGSGEAVRTAYNAVQLRVTQMYEAAGLLNTEASLMQIIGGGENAMPTQPTMPDFNMSDAGKAALERNLQ
jgi:hypothetical protein